MVVLTIDPGSKLAGCLLGDASMPWVFEIRKPTAAQVIRVVRWAKVWADERGGEKLELVIEDQHIARGSTANLASVLSVARSAERWVFAAELYGIQTVRAQPASWRSPVVKSVAKLDENGEALDLKARTQVAVGRLWPTVLHCKGEPGVVEFVERETKTFASDPCDAMGMARWRQMGGALKVRLPSKRASSKRKRKAAAA
jgi:hypothetical protein